MTTRPVAILGQGVAGMLAALALAEAGVAPVLLAPPPSRGPAPVCPVHRLPEAMWLAPPPWLRGLDAALRSVGACAGERHLLAPGVHHRQALALLPDKSMLEAALRLLVRRQRRIHRQELARGGVVAADGCWRMETADGPGPLTASLLVDASGARRASLPVLAAAGGWQPAQELCEGRQTFLTLALRQAAAQPRSCWLLDESPGQGWLIDWAPDGSATVTERVPAPATAAAGDPTARMLERLRHSVDRLAITPLQAWLRRAEPLGAASLHRAPPARRLVLDGPATAPGTGGAWLAVGDALVQTPPWLGQGVAQAGRHAEALAQAWTGAAGLGAVADRARERLDTLAARQLQAAALAGWAEATATAAS